MLQTLGTTFWDHYQFLHKYFQMFIINIFNCDCTFWERLELLLDINKEIFLKYLLGYGLKWTILFKGDILEIKIFGSECRHSQYLKKQEFWEKMQVYLMYCAA